MYSDFRYVRGVPLNKQSSIHIAGCGDHKIKDISFLPDPCPLPEQLKKRALVERERLIYAPFSGVGGIVFDKDAIYVELGGSHSHQKEDSGLISNLLQTQETLDQKLEKSEMQFFTDSAPIKSQDVKQIFAEEKVVDQGRIRRKVIFNDSKEAKSKLADGNEDDDDDDNDEDDDDAEEDGEFGENIDQDSENEQESGDEEDDDSAPEDSKKRKATHKSSVEKKLKLDPSIETEENGQVYRGLSKNQDKHVKNRISEALSLLESNSKSKKTPSTSKSEDNDDDESYDELSGDEEMDFQLRVENESGQENESEDDEDEKGEDEESNIRWKENIAQRAKEAFLDRQQTGVNITKLVYGVFDEVNRFENEKNNEDDDGEADEIGGIFHVVQAKQKQKVQERELKNQEESVFYNKDQPRDWLDDQNKALIVDRFITGKWKDSEDAEELLKLGNLLLFAKLKIIIGNRKKFAQ